MERLKQSGAGRLYFKVAFDKRDVVDDGYGNPVSGDWQEQFTRRVEFVHMFGSETVIAAQLESRQPMKVMVRSDSQTRQIANDWQMRDVRRNVPYNIRDIRPENNRAMIGLLVESGVATG